MKIVIDGAIDMPPALDDSPLLQRVLGEVWMGTERYTGDAAEFWAQVRSGRYPSTTPPTVNALVDAYEQSDVVIGLHVSGQLSATVARADEAAVRVGSGVVVIDTRSLSVGAGLIVAAVHKAAQAEQGLASLVAFARQLPDRLHTYALVQDVASLRRGDRAGLLPSSHLEHNHPLVVAVRGRVVALAQAKHRGGALEELGRHLRRTVGADLGAWALGHGDAADVDRVADYLTNGLGRPPSYSTPLDPTVGTHLGPDSVVVGALTGAVDL